MYSKSEFLPRELRAWLVPVTPDEPEILRRLREETASYLQPRMQIPPEQGHLLALLARACQARQTLEIGVFTGYSSLAVALALPDDGRITALDISDEYTRVARRYWTEAGVADRIELRIGPALQSLAALVSEGREGAFDFAFIDADKPNYDAYYEYCLRLLRSGGLIVIDNVFQDCKVLDEANQEPGVTALRRLSAKLKADARVLMSVLPMADGITLVLKK